MNKGILKNAFTLIELLVVIAIIGILSGLIIVGMNSSIQSATVAKAQIFSASLRDSMLASLVSDWKFDGSGIADGSNATAAYTQDTWGNNHCTIGGTPLVYSGNNCVYGSCLKFNGTADYLSAGNASALNVSNAITMETWIYKNANNGSIEVIMGKGNEVISSAGYRMLYNSGSDKLLISNSDGVASYSAYTTNTVGISLNKWYHVVGVMDSTSRKIYLNGVLLQSWIDASHNFNINSYAFVIGCSSTGSIGGQYFNGTIDNVRVYGAAIPTSQIKEHYHVGLNTLLSKKEINIDEYQIRINSSISSLSRK